MAVGIFILLRLEGGASLPTGVICCFTLANGIYEEGGLRVGMDYFT